MENHTTIQLLAELKIQCNFYTKTIKTRNGELA